MNKVHRVFNIKDTVNKAIRYVKANPCIICTNMYLCGAKHKKTCKVRRQLIFRLYPVKEIDKEEIWGR